MYESKCIKCKRLYYTAAPPENAAYKYCSDINCKGELIPTAKDNPLEKKVQSKRRRHRYW